MDGNPFFFLVESVCGRERASGGNAMGKTKEPSWLWRRASRWGAGKAEGGGGGGGRRQRELVRVGGKRTGQCVSSDRSVRRRRDRSRTAGPPGPFVRPA